MPSINIATRTDTLAIVFDTFHCRESSSKIPIADCEAMLESRCTGSIEVPVCKSSAKPIQQVSSWWASYWNVLHIEAFMDSRLSGMPGVVVEISGLIFGGL